MAALHPDSSPPHPRKHLKPWPGRCGRWAPSWWAWPSAWASCAASRPPTCQVCCCRIRIHGPPSLLLRSRPLTYLVHGPCLHISPLACSLNRGVAHGRSGRAGRTVCSVVPGMACTCVGLLRFLHMSEWRQLLRQASKACAACWAPRQLTQAVRSAGAARVDGQPGSAHCAALPVPGVAAVQLPEPPASVRAGAGPRAQAGPARCPTALTPL